MKQIRITIISIMILTLVLGIAYPLLICSMRNLFFPYQARGSLIESPSQRIIGSKWIGQNFSAPQYFHPRPSYAGENGYDAMASGGSDLGPTSKNLMDVLRSRIDRYRAENNIEPSQRIPADAVMASGSGLDPHISPDNAFLQASRVAAARNMALSTIKEMIRKTTSRRFMGIFGEPHVNVLMLNIQLDQMGRSTESVD